MTTAIGLVSVNPETYVSSSNSEGFLPGSKYAALVGTVVKEYRFVQNHATDGALSAGFCCTRTSASNWVVTSSFGTSSLGSAFGAGLCPRSVPVANWFFMLVDGPFAAAVNSTNAVTGGSAVKASGAVPGDFLNLSAAVSECYIGRAEANASGGVFPMMVTIG